MGRVIAKYVCDASLEFWDYAQARDCHQRKSRPFVRTGR